MAAEWANLEIISIHEISGGLYCANWSTLHLSEAWVRELHYRGCPYGQARNRRAYSQRASPLGSSAQLSRVRRANSKGCCSTRGSHATVSNAYRADSAARCSSALR